MAKNAPPRIHSNEGFFRKYNYMKIAVFDTGLSPPGFDTFVGLDHPLANIESEVCCAVEDNVHDGLEGVGRQPFRRRNEIARGVVDHHVGEA